MKAKSLAINIAKYAIGFGLLAFVLWRSWGDKVQNGKVIPGLATTLQKPPDWALIPLGAALIAFVVVIQLYRWYLLVRAVDLPFTKWNALRLGLVGYFYNSFLPGAIGGDAVKMWVHRQGSSDAPPRGRGHRGHRPAPRALRPPAHRLHRRRDRLGVGQP